jgi:hypothetical protein
VTWTAVVITAPAALLAGWTVNASLLAELVGWSGWPLQPKARTTLDRTNQLDC